MKSRSDLDDGCERAIEIKRIVRLRGIRMPETGDRAMKAMMGSYIAVIAVRRNEIEVTGCVA